LCLGAWFVTILFGLSGLGQNSFFADSLNQFLKRSRIIADKNINCFQPAGISFAETETANLRLKLKAITDEK
jgi:hypothetical protein